MSCEHKNISVHPVISKDVTPTELHRAFNGENNPIISAEYICDACGLTGDSEDDIRGEGTIEAQIEEEHDERSERERLLTELGQTLAQTPEELFVLMDEKMFRQIMSGYVTIKLRPHDKLIGYFILSIQQKDVAFVPDPEEGCRFAAAMMLKAASTIPKLRQYDEDGKVARLIHTNGNSLKLIQ